MEILGHGIDLSDIADIERLLRQGDHFLMRCFTESERQAGAERPDFLQYAAGRFAAKEAVLKALGTGWRDGISFLDVEIGSLPSGAPTITLHGTCAQIAAEQGITAWLLSISHTGTHAVASVIAAGESVRTS